MPDIRLDHAPIKAARTLLDAANGASAPGGSPWAALAAAGLAASTAVVLAGLMILGPGVILAPSTPAEAAFTRLMPND